MVGLIYVHSIVNGAYNIVIIDVSIVMQILMSLKLKKIDVYDPKSSLLIGHILNTDISKRRK